MKHGFAFMVVVAATATVASPAAAQTPPAAVEFVDSEPLTVKLAELRSGGSVAFELTNTQSGGQKVQVRLAALAPVDAFSAALFQSPAAYDLGPYQTKRVELDVGKLGKPTQNSYTGSIVVTGTEGPLARRKVVVVTDVAAASPCAAADALEEAGQHDEAQTEYVAVLKKNESEPCAVNALDGGLTARLQQALDKTTGLAVVLAGWLAIAAGVVLLAALVPPTRWLLVKVPWLHRRLAPRLSLQDFGDSKAFTALVREELARETGAGQYRLDRVSGKEGFGTALEAIEEVDPSVKRLSALYEAIEQLLPRARFTASGALQEKGEWGEGATVLLEGGDATTSTTLWMPAAGTDSAGHQPLAIPVGAWIDYQVHAALDGPPAVGNARSFAFLQAGLAYQQRGKLDAAQRLFAAACAEDTANVAARINDANLKARGLNQYKEAIAELEAVIEILHAQP